MKKILLSVAVLFFIGILTAQAANVSVNLMYDTVANTVSQVANAKTAGFRASFFTATSTTQTNTFPLLTTNTATATTICLTGDTCRTTWPAGGGGTSTVYVSTTTVTTGQVAVITGPGTIGSVATGTISTDANFTVTANRSAIGGATAIGLASGLTVPTTTGLQTLYASSHNPVTLSGTPNYITLVGQDIVRAFINLGTHVTGILGITNGGTGTSTAPTTDQILVGNAAGNYEYRRFEAGSNITLSTSTSGRITITSTASGSSSGDMVLASAQTNSGLKTFLNGTFGLRNIANTITSFFETVATVARTWRFPDKDGTVALTSDIATSTWGSLTQAWIYPSSYGCAAESAYQNNQIHTLKAEYFSLAATGTTTPVTLANSGCDGYSATTSASIASSSEEQFITVSGNATGFAALMASTTLQMQFIATSTYWLNLTGFTGIELDIEGFASWSQVDTNTFYLFVDELAKNLHSNGKKLMIDVPPIWNSAANSDSGTGDEWDSANSTGYYKLTYERLALTAVDYIVIMAYDYHFDYGGGSSIQPLKWVREIVNFAKKKIIDHNRIVIGMPNYGYHAATGAYDITNLTYTEMLLRTGSSTAVRDPLSGEMKWTNAGRSNVYVDAIGMDIKRQYIERLGIKRVSIWHLGGNQWFASSTNSGRYELGNMLSPTLTDWIASSTGATTTNVYYNRGNVGIGTTTPHTMLTVAGTSTFTTATIKTLLVGASSPTSLTNLFQVATSTWSMFSIDTSGHIYATTTSPVLSSCGTSPTMVGGDSWGTVTTGATANGCTITFASQFTSAPTCTVTNRSMSLVNAMTYTTSASALTITQTAIGGALVDYHCFGTK